MGEKKKHKDRDRDRSESKQAKKSKKKVKDNKKDKSHKKKSDKRSRSYSQSQSSSQQSSRSRSARKSKKKKARDSPDKDKPSFTVPFSMIPNLPPPPGSQLRPGAIMMPPPTPAATSTSVHKLKAKQPHIFKLLAKLPIHSVNLGRTIYSSELMGPGFEKPMLVSLCDTVEKCAKNEGYKKLSYLITKAKNQIQGENKMDEDKENDKKQNAPLENKIQEEVKGFKNQFDVIGQIYTKQIQSLKKGFVSA